MPTRGISYNICEKELTSKPAHIEKEASTSLGKQDPNMNTEDAEASEKSTKISIILGTCKANTP